MSKGDLQKYKLRRSRTSDAWGFKITTCGNKTFITGVYNDTPAEKAGVVLYEVIVTINRVPCDNVSHEYVYHVIKKIDHNMTLVTRKATPDEVRLVDNMTKLMPIEAHYENVTSSSDVSSAKENFETKRKSKSTERNRDRRHKDEEKRKESNSPDSKQKKRSPSENHFDRQHGSGVKGDTKSSSDEEKRKAKSKTTPPNGTKENLQKDGKSRKKRTRTPENSPVNDVKEDRRHRTPKSKENGDHREEKREKNHESRVINGEDNSPSMRRETNSKPKESTPRPVSDISSTKPAKTESSEGKKQEAMMPNSSEKAPQMLKSKSAADLHPVMSDSVEEDDDEEVFQGTKESFPTMMEIRANLQAGKRRTLLLSRGDSFEDRVDQLNNM